MKLAHSVETTATIGVVAPAVALGDRYTQRALAAPITLKSAITRKYSITRVTSQVEITRTPPHYLPEILGELFSAISGNDYRFPYT